MKQRLLALGVSQQASHIRREGNFIIIDERNLPDMHDPRGDWSVSATGQWSLEEMGWIATDSASELARSLAETEDPWLHMGVTAELILHDDILRAREFVQQLVQRQPQAKNGFTQYFGTPLMIQLLEKIM